MSLMEDILQILGGRCRTEVDHFAGRLRGLLGMFALCLVAGILLLWTIGFLIAALFIGLFPHLGAPGAAGIAAGACLLLSLIVLGIALHVSK